MKLVFFTNHLNHHQVGVADELYNILGDDFVFVSTMPFDANELKGGMDYSHRPYCINSSISDYDYRKASELAQVADVCVFGACSQKFAIERAKFNPTGLSFDYAERWLKKGAINLLSPVFIKWYLNYQRYYRHASFYRLCAGAFTKKDDLLLGCYKNKHFKWGYFTPNAPNLPTRQPTNDVKLMWCSRFIKWKHPEIPILLAKHLKQNFNNFVIDLYGDGELRKSIEMMSKKLQVKDVVIFHGNKPNEDIRKAMKEHDIFLFTSDRQEGWGVVANEALSNGCVLLASEDIGSTPYLLQNNYNGFSFKTGDYKSLVQKVKWLIEHTIAMENMKINSIKTIAELWTPLNAANSLLTLIDDLNHNRATSIKEGPCSNA